MSPVKESVAILCPRVRSKNESSEDTLEEREHYMLEKNRSFIDVAAGHISVSKIHIRQYSECS